MRVTVVHAHPCPESYVAALRDRTLLGLRRAGHETHLVDLHDRSYDPFLPLPAADAAVLDGTVALVLVHPTWWTSHPAILLAWLGQAVETTLPSVRTIVSVTTLGGGRLANGLAGESGRRMMDRAVRRRCSNEPVHRRLAFYGIDRSTPAQRAAFLERVESRIADLVR
jgi:NAD(P)H dehydrogenase (quinone)